MQKQWDVYVYGDVNIDLVVPNVDALPEPGIEEEVPVMETFVGGGAALFALGIAKLGLKPAFQGSVGKDMYGAAIREVFHTLGVDDRLLLDSRTKKTGISISFTTEKDRCFLTYRGASEGLSLKHLRIDQVSGARHIHVTGYEGVSNHAEYLEMLTKIHALGNVSVSFDVGWDTTGVWNEGIFELLPMIDVLFMNETECLHYTRSDDVEAGARRLAEKAGMAVIKLGRKGSLAIQNGERYFVPAYSVQAVDTTGAGDSFNAGFVYGYLQGLPMEECLRCGNGCGALSVTKLGGNTGFPFRPELEKWIRDHE
ncbi:MAG: carbohydrate kinase family protein [Candidatus Faecivicinus sp.]|nr:carbohydrate kinase family protein [Candidatus Faecivicinus sp.]